MGNKGVIKTELAIQESRGQRIQCDKTVCLATDSISCVLTPPNPVITKWQGWKAVSSQEAKRG